jgi:16S rRNA (guanine527-N7)-methyltransferase
MTAAQPVKAMATSSRPAIRPMAPTLSAEARSTLSAYLDLLGKWNRVYNLTAIRERDRMETLHVEDALAVLPFLPDKPGLRLLDVGSGGGVPGIPIAIARPSWHVVLVEANGKKAAFLQQAIIELGLSNVTSRAVRIEAFGETDRFDVVIARAFSDLGTFARVAREHVAPGGLIVAMKGPLPREEMAALPQDVAVTATPALDVAGVDAARHLVIMQTKDGRG